MSSQSTTQVDSLYRTHKNFSSCNAAPTEYARHAPPRRDHGGGQRGIFMALRWRHAIRADHFTLPREYLCTQRRAHAARPPAPPASLHAQQHDSTRARAAAAHARARTSSCPWQRPPRARNARIRKTHHRPGKPVTAPRHTGTPGQHGTQANPTRNPAQLDGTNPTNLTNPLQSLPSAASPRAATTP